MVIKNLCSTLPKSVAFVHSQDDSDSLKKRQAAKAKAWENELRRRCEALKPIIISFIQVASTNKTRQDEKKKLEAYRAVPLTMVPIATSYTKQEKAKASEEGGLSGEGENSYMAQQRLAGSIGNKLKPVTEDGRWFKSLKMMEEFHQHGCDTS